MLFQQGEVLCGFELQMLLQQENALFEFAALNAASAGKGFAWICSLKCCFSRERFCLNLQRLMLLQQGKVFSRFQQQMLLRQGRVLPEFAALNTASAVKGLSRFVPLIAASAGKGFLWISAANAALAGKHFVLICCLKCCFSSEGFVQISMANTASCLNLQP